MKTACIIGSQGQDGQLLWNLLQSRNYRLIGVGFQEVRARDTIWTESVNILDREEVLHLIEKVRPDEIYYLAAKHQSSQDIASENLGYYRETFDINVNGLAHFLEAILMTQSGSKLFYASSSHVFGSQIFGQPLETPQVETTAYHPESIYAISKVTGTHLCRLYRQKHGVFASVGILYNHESSLRKDSFLSKKIVTSALRIQNGHQKKLIVGNLSTQVDWGYAPDYVEAMHLVLNLKDADEFIIASGKTHSVADFLEVVFSSLGLDWRVYVEEDRRILTRQEGARVGDFSKLKQATGWTPQTSFEEMVKQLLKSEERLMTAVE